MKIRILLLSLVVLLTACGPNNSQPNPNPNASKWGTAKWNEGTWE